MIRDEASIVVVLALVLACAWIARPFGGAAIGVLVSCVVQSERSPW